LEVKEGSNQMELDNNEHRPSFRTVQLIDKDNTLMGKGGKMSKEQKKKMV